jgi:small subunit ribosomal protein S20
MANHKSAKKRNRQIQARTVRARAFRTRVRNALKVARAAIAEKSPDAAKLVSSVSSLLARAGSKNDLPKKRTARLISRLNLALAASKG